ncbi:MAG: response regulator [Gemmataceae bacterium]|nr:response regulator [Gemmataceae bacterium]MDW8264030.1 response regulator [Gemmataceae bacterium]
MLVLSRRPGQRVVFPTVDVSVQVVEVKGSAVRLGIEAPPHVAVLREELLQPSVSPEKANHDFRNRLNSLVMALHVAEKQLQAGHATDAQATLREAQQFLEKLGSSALADAAVSPKPIETLLVEDNPNEVALLASYLRLSGFRVQSVHDGLEALDFLARHHKPDFVLLDMRLPRCDGAATVSAIRENPALADVRIFVVSGAAPSEYNLPTGRHGVDAWFQKPLNPRRLVEAMNAAVSRN